MGASSTRASKQRARCQQQTAALRTPTPDARHVQTTDGLAPACASWRKLAPGRVFGLAITLGGAWLQRAPNPLPLARHAHVPASCRAAGRRAEGARRRGAGRGASTVHGARCWVLAGWTGIHHAETTDARVSLAGVWCDSCRTRLTSRVGCCTTEEVGHSRGRCATDSVREPARRSLARSLARCCMIQGCARDP